MTATHIQEDRSIGSREVCFVTFMNQPKAFESVLTISSFGSFLQYRATKLVSHSERREGSTFSLL